MTVRLASKGDAAHGEGRVRPPEPRGAESSSRAERADHHGPGPLARSEQFTAWNIAASRWRCAGGSRVGHALDAECDWNLSGRAIQHDTDTDRDGKERIERPRTNK